MMPRLLVVILLGWLANGAQAARLPVLAYHDLVQEPASDELAVTAAQFSEQMAYLKQHGYQPISLQTCKDAAQGRTRLPEKAVMLTFDDGLASFSEIAMPILERYRFPAVLSVTTGWLMGEAVPDAYRGRVLTPEALGKVSQNPSIEIVSHSHRLHESLTADPQGSQGAAGVSRRYLSGSGYESEADYRQRIRKDLRTSVERLAAGTGRKPRGVAWPYGLNNAVLAEEAAALGLEAQLALDDRPADCAEYPYLSRLLLRRVRTLAEFETALRLDKLPSPIRMVEIRLDEVATAPVPKQDAMLRQLAERVRLLRANLVIVHPYTADGSTAHFANPGMPYRADLLHRALHLLRATATVRERMLMLPASMQPKETLMELARRHPYEGIVLTGQYSPELATWVRTLFTRYQPRLRCGMETANPAGSCQEFRLVAAQMDNLQEQQAVSGSTGITSYFLVRPATGQGVNEVAEQLRQLRRHDIPHFGLAADGLLRNPDAIRRIAIEFAAFVPAGRRD